MQVTKHVRSAFTLIEVLIAVLVLSLGVLGLAAVFSVGIPQQRIASDQIQGLNALASARAVLLGNERLNNPTNPSFPDFRQLRGWYGLQQRVADDPAELFEINKTWSPMGEWMLPLPDPGDSDIDEVWISHDLVAEDADKDVGEVVIVSPELVQSLDVRIGLEQRLVPAPYTRGTEPQYVWDFIARRVPSGQIDLSTGIAAPTKQDEIEVVVFVRRIDPGIRVQLTRRTDEDSRLQFGPRLRLSDYLTMNAQEITGGPTDPINEVLRIVPVSMDPDSSQPRNDGRTLGAGTNGEYAMPFGIGVAAAGQYPGARRGGPGGGGSIEIPRDRLPLEPGGATPEDENRLRLATQVGHRILDRFGNIYEIRGIDEELSEQLNATVVRIDPPVPSHILAPIDFRYLNRADLDSKAFITTPQRPIAIDVFRVNP